MSRPENPDKYPFIDRKNHKDAVTVTIKLTCAKDIVAVAKYRKSIFESDQSAYQERQQSIMT